MKHYVGEYGTKLRIYTGQDLTNALQVSLIVKKPNGTEVEWIGAVVDTNYIEYTVRNGDFDIPGKYVLQAKIVANNGEWYGDRFTIVVYDKYD